MTKPMLSPASGGPAGAVDLVHALILNFFPELVAEMGADPADLLDAFGITPDEAMRARASNGQMAELLKLATAVWLERSSSGHPVMLGYRIMLEADRLTEIAQFVEQVGFEGGEFRTFILTRMTDSDYPDVWSSFAAMAAVTTKVRLSY